MKYWKLKIGIWDRLIFAWNAFWLKKYSKSFPFTGSKTRLVDAAKKHACDVGGIGNKKGCKDGQKWCISRPVITISVGCPEHYHVCEFHGNYPKWHTIKELKH